jgi:hypothetical protein
MTDDPTQTVRRFVARVPVHRRDCVKCHAAPGIWRDPDNRPYFICDDCLARLWRKKPNAKSSALVNPDAR